MIRTERNHIVYNKRLLKELLDEKYKFKKTAKVDMEYFYTEGLSSRLYNSNYIVIGGNWISEPDFEILKERDWLDFGYMDFKGVGTILWIQLNYTENDKS